MRLDEILGSETVFLSVGVASSSSESGSAAFSFSSSPLMELQCLTALWMRCQAEPEPLHLHFTRRAQSRSKHNPAVHIQRQRPKLSLLETELEKTFLLLPGLQHSLSGFCLWTPTGAQSQALNMSALNSPGQKGCAGFIHLPGELSLPPRCLGVRVPLSTSVCWLCWTGLQHNPDCSES